MQSVYGGLVVLGELLEPLVGIAGLMIERIIHCKIERRSWKHGRVVFGDRTLHHLARRIQISEAGAAAEPIPAMSPIAVGACVSGESVLGLGELAERLGAVAGRQQTPRGA